jgi:hypothetical protein
MIHGTRRVIHETASLILLIKFLQFAGGLLPTCFRYFRFFFDLNFRRTRQPAVLFADGPAAPQLRSFVILNSARVKHGKN